MCPFLKHIREFFDHTTRQRAIMETQAGAYEAVATLTSTDRVSPVLRVSSDTF